MSTTMRNPNPKKHFRFMDPEWERTTNPRYQDRLRPEHSGIHSRFEAEGETFILKPSHMLFAPLVAIRPMSVRTLNLLVGESDGGLIKTTIYQRDGRSKRLVHD